MPSRESRRKRALDVDGGHDDTRAQTLRHLLASRKISVTTLNEIVQTLQNQPDALSASLGDLKAAAASFFEGVRHELQVLMQDGTCFTWTLCEPNLLLGRTLKECPNLAALYRERMRKHPCSVDRPWSMIVMFDAFSPVTISCPRPGAQKTMNVMYNFLELGAAALSLDKTWLVPVSVRYECVSNAVGGWSACLAMYLRLHLLGPHNIQSVGVAFDVLPEKFIVFAKLKVLGSDGEGLKEALDLKGFSGLVPCIRCINVLKKDSGLAHRRPNYVEITCWDASKFESATRDDFESHVDELIAAKRQVRANAMPKARLALMEKAYGINANPSGLVADARLRNCFVVLDVMCED